MEPHAREAGKHCRCPPRTLGNEFDSEYFRNWLTAGAAQNPKYHPEGDAFTHTILVMNQAARLRTQARCPCLYAGSPAMTTGRRYAQRRRTEKIVSHGHGGLSPGPELHGSLWPGLGDEPVGANHVEYHMRPNGLYLQNSSKKPQDGCLRSRYVRRIGYAGKGGSIKRIGGPTRDYGTMNSGFRSA